MTEDVLTWLAATLQGAAKVLHCKRLYLVLAESQALLKDLVFHLIETFLVFSLFDLSLL